MSLPLQALSSLFVISYINLDITCDGNPPCTLKGCIRKGAKHTMTSDHRKRYWTKRKECQIKLIIFSIEFMSCEWLRCFDAMTFTIMPDCTCYQFPLTLLLGIVQFHKFKYTFISSCWVNCELECSPILLWKSKWFCQYIYLLSQVKNIDSQGTHILEYADATVSGRPMFNMKLLYKCMEIFNRWLLAENIIKFMRDNLHLAQ